MASRFDIAKPYAKAAFAYAKENKTLSVWQTFLHTASDIASHPLMITYLCHPRLSKTQIFELFYSIYHAQNPVSLQAYQNFLLLLAHNNRLILLPKIAELFNTNVAQQRCEKHARIITAIPLHARDQELFHHLLTKRIGQNMVLECITDPTIVGGIIIDLGDQVIDASIRGRLTRLHEFLLR